MVASIVFTDPSTTAGSEEVLLGDGTASMSGEPIALSSEIEVFALQVMAVGDLDGDGLDDIVAMMVEQEDVLLV